MSVKTEAAEYLELLKIASTDPRYQALYTFARKNGLETGTITLQNDEIHSVAAYAMQVYCHAVDIASPATNEDHVPYLIVSLLMALEAASRNTWSYGGKLRYYLQTAGIKIKRSEWNAFMAQNGTFQSNYNKLSLMENNLLAVSLHCADMIARYNSLPGLGKGLQDTSGKAYKEILDNRKATDMETIEFLARDYIGAKFGGQNREYLERFLAWLRQSDYYVAPAATSGLHNFPGGLAFEVVETIYYMAKLLLPATADQIGEIVMAAILSFIHKVGVFIPDGSGGFVYQDNMCYGEGMKNLYIATHYLGKVLPEHVAAAIDGYGYDTYDNPNVGLQMMEYPLALYLHVGTVAAALLRSPREPVANGAAEAAQ